ncbi:MAG: M18 family aminopeptidase [Nitrospinota bacterium]|nr:M18 family aminopeptidase [Nitrospinota bacterium]
MEGYTDKTKTDPYLSTGRALLQYIDKCPTPFHAVAELRNLLKERQFIELNEADPWSLSPGGKYFTVRNESSMVVFKTGSDAPEKTGYKIIGAHTDSPNLRLKPDPTYHKNGYVQLGVEVYGGVLLSTWTDRDLSLAGRVFLRDSGGKTVAKLFMAEQPVVRIPQLAIHLNRKVNEKGLILNKQNHLPPIFSLTGGSSEDALKQWLGDQLDCSPSEILSMDLSLYDVQKGALAGPENEFLFVSRLDNLASCHAAAMAFLEVDEPGALIFYDNEEIGSVTAQGAGSPFLKDVLERIQLGIGASRESFLRALARSLFISADMAHAVHPNYADKHDSQHMPVINQGPVIKVNAGQRYATDGDTAARFELLCERAGVPVQKFVMRSDLACGSTIGPITAAKLGIRTVDVGNPMLSMHSIREMAGSKDHWDLVRVLKEFFRSG